MGGASRAVMSKIMAHEGAAAAMATTMEKMQGAAGGRRRDVPPRRRACRRAPTEVGERDGRGVADVERVDAGGDRDAHAARRPRASAAADRPGPSAPSSTATRAGTASVHRSAASSAGVSAHVSKPAAWSTSRSSGQCRARATGRWSTSPMLTRTVRR